MFIKKGWYMQTPVRCNATPTLVASVWKQAGSMASTIWDPLLLESLPLVYVVTMQVREVKQT